MARNLNLPPMSVEVQTLASVGRPSPAKVQPSPAPGSLSICEVVKCALKEQYGKLERAAAAMGGMDPSQMTRDLHSGNFRLERLDMLDAAGKAAVSKALNEKFGVVADPKSEARRVIREAHRKLDEVADLLEIA